MIPEKIHVVDEEEGQDEDLDSHWLSLAALARRSDNWTSMWWMSFTSLAFVARSVCCSCARAMAA